MKAYEHLVDFALKRGHVISVWDTEEWQGQVKKCSDKSAIIQSIESIEDCQVRIRNADGGIVGWAHVIAYDVGDDETVADYSIDEFMNEWIVEYKSNLDERGEGW